MLSLSLVSTNRKCRLLPESERTTSAGCSTTESKRERKVNFNDVELRVILDLFKTNASILNGKFTPNVTQKGKNCPKYMGSLLRLAGLP